MPLEGKWFTEVCPESGSAFSLKIKDKVYEEKTPYQHLEIYQTEDFGALMVLDGLVMLSARDNFIYHEMMTHPALFSHPCPRRVLIIGGGDCGSLQQVLKHATVARAEQVELDQAVTRAAEKYFPELCRANDDPRARFHFTDGIDWVARAAPGGYDVIIVDSTDPVGPALGLFSEDFYRNCHRALGEHGVLAAQSESPLIHLDILGGMRRAMAAAGFSQVRTLHFPQCTYPSGWWSATLAAKNLDLEAFRRQDAEARDFSTDYYNAAVHRAALALPEFLRRALAQAGGD